MKSSQKRSVKYFYFLPKCQLVGVFPGLANVPLKLIIFYVFFIYFYFHLFSLVALKSIQIVQQLQAPRATHMFVGENKMKWKFLWFPLPEFRCLNERDLLSNIKTDNEEQLKYWIRKVLFIACNCILCWRPQGHHELTCWAKIEPT